MAAAVPAIFGWGYWGHQRISRAAIFPLPDSMRVFFFNHIDYITEEAVMPDVRIYAINYRQEVNRHFIDMEHFNLKAGETMPATLADAIIRFGDSDVQKAGILPWYIDEIFIKLTKAFKDGTKHNILFQGADLAHYISDAHVPLHTTNNHDGQLTGQKGIHTFWEAQLPENFGDSINFNTGQARYIPDVKKEIWSIIQHSHSLIDSLLLADKNLSAQFAPGDIYEKDSAGNILKNRFNQSRHTRTYASRYNELLNGMIRQQVRASISAVSNFWYTAWVNAGSPDIESLDPPSLTKSNRKQFRKEYRMWKKGKLFGIKSLAEF